MALNNEFLVVPSLKWLGIHSKDFSVDDSAVMPFNVADSKKLQDLACNSFISDANDCRGWSQQIQVMKSVSLKAEIEILSDRAGGMSQQIKKKVKNHDWL